MNPHAVFCPNMECPARGQAGKGNIWIHSVKEERYRCKVCGRTFRPRQGTLFAGLRTAPETVTLVLVLLAHGCPLQAIVHAFGFDERTVRTWQLRAGRQCQAVHAHLVAAQPLELVHVQADEIKVKTQGRHLWMAMGVLVASRLWLGGVVRATRDAALLRQMLAPVRQMALCGPLLVCVDGLSTYVDVLQKLFRTQLPRLGRGGRCILQPWSELVIAQVIKKRLKQGLDLSQRIVQGSEAQLNELLALSQGGTQINTAFIERLNATFRQRCASLVRRTRAPARQEQTLVAGMWLVGTLYNFCAPHRSLTLDGAPDTQPGSSQASSSQAGSLQRTPAMTATLTDHIWSPGELFAYRVPPPPVAPAQAHRPSFQPDQAPDSGVVFVTPPPTVVLPDLADCTDFTDKNRKCLLCSIRKIRLIRYIRV